MPLVLVQDDETLQHSAVRKELLRPKLCTLRRTDPDGRLVRDEAGDSSRLARLCYDVDSLQKSISMKDVRNVAHRFASEKEKSSDAQVQPEW